MRVLVTGAEGQVGAELVRLDGPDFHVIAYGRSELDITRRDDVVSRLEETAPDLLVNCAAYTAVDAAEDEPDLAHRINADAVGLLGRACAARGVGVVHLSTDYVFDGAKRDAYVETDPPNPLGVYGASKLAGEEALRDATDQHVILRVSWVFGRLGRSFVDTILRLAKERSEISVVDDQIGSPSPATAIAEVLRLIALRTASDSAWGTYHFSTQPSLSWCAFAREIVRIGVETGVLNSSPTVRAIATKDWPAKARRPLNSTLNAAKLEATFGARPPCWEGPLREYIETSIK